MLHALNLQDEKFELLNVINGVDFLQHWGQPNSSFDVELSYTWLDYRIMEQIISKSDFDANNIDTEQKLQLCFNLWPLARGILHMLALGGAREGKLSGDGDQI